jgi:flagellar M-ring protein FliF
VQAFVDFLKSLGAARLTAMVAVTLTLIGFFAFVIIRMSGPQLVPLFTDLSIDDSASIVKELDRQGIEYQLKSNGSVIMVPGEKVGRLRISLAESGLPKSGVGYEIFDKSDALGATNFIQNINHLRAMEGELARTIRSIDGVLAARVHLVLPERPLFTRDKVDASASIVLRLRGQLQPQQVRAIRHLVASAVNGLKPDHVSVVDETGQLLADGAGPANLMEGGNLDDKKGAYETRMRKQVEDIVSSIVGPGHARVQVTADFDYHRITQTSDQFDPDSRVVRSSQTRDDQSATADNKEAGPVSAANQLPGNIKDDANGNARDQSHKTEEIVNYEISRVTKTEVTEPGRVSRISAAVLVDGVYTSGADGKPNYQPRSKEEIDRIAALVRTAIGFDSKRGDQVEVVNLRFAEPTPIPIDEPMGWMRYFQLTRQDIMRIAETGVMGLLSLVVLFMIVRPLVKRIITPENPTTNDVAGGASGGGGGMIVDGGPNISIVGPDDPVTISNHTSTMIDIAQVQGQVHAQSVQKVGDLAEKNPHEAVSIIRSWLHEDAA